MRRFTAAPLALALLAAAPSADADPHYWPTSPAETPAPAAADDTTPRDVKVEVPFVAYTQSAFGAHERTVGAQGYGEAHGDPAQHGFGGGFVVYGSPVDRLTLIGTTERGLFHEWAPTGTVAFRIAGSVEQGWGLAALARYKMEGFDEAGGEIETGVMFSLSRSRAHLDVNAIGGTGTEEAEGGEMDVEARVRAGYDVLPWMRLGLDGQARYRVHGDKALAGGRSGDFVGGPQAMIAFGRFYGAATAGPSTVDVASGIGWTGMLTLGAASL